jgi:hypothetical protein
MSLLLQCYVRVRNSLFWTMEYESPIPKTVLEESNGHKFLLRCNGNRVERKVVMNKINLQFLDDVLGPLIGGADDDEQIERYRNFDSKNEYLVKDIIAKTIKPRFDQRSDLYKNAVKKALAYSLLTDSVDFERVYDSNLIAFNAPSNPRDFFFWIWEVLFFEEPVALEENVASYEIVRDWREPIQISINEKKLREEGS